MIRIADFTIISIKSIDNVILHLNVHDESQIICLKNVHHVSNSEYNLFSMRIIEFKEFKFRVKNERTECYASDRKICLIDTRQSSEITYFIDLNQSKLLRTTRKSFDDAS